MRAVDWIRKKRDGGEMSAEELAALIEGYTNGTVPDYQMAAWAMAVYYQGMTPRETADLTLAMARSGEQVDLSAIPGIKVDKHSTGGVGDTTTLVLGPLVAAAGIPVAKMSGRGLGHTGGTVDKLEAIPGFSVERTREAFLRQLREIGLAVISQSGNIAPADKLLYALRDVTATVDSIPLIASSIMSKKIASGADRILLDVKTGRGAFMKTLEASIELARAMVEIGTQVGRETVAVITDMDEPLAPSIGNALEVREAIDTLAGRGPKQLTQLCLELASHMIRLGGKASTREEGLRIAEELLASGAALNKFKAMVAAQEGDPRIADQPELLPAARSIVPVVSPQDGCIASIDAELLGVTAMRLGAGRAKKDDPIEPAVGIRLLRRSGDTVSAGEPLAELHMSESEEAEKARMTAEALTAFRFSSEPPAPKPLIYAVITKEGIERMPQ